MTVRRKRLLIALAFVAMLAGALWWLSRPRIDPALVGAWRSQKLPDLTLRLNSDATGRLELLTPIPRVLTVSWSVSGSRLYVREKTSGFDAIVAPLLDCYAILKGDQPRFLITGSAELENAGFVRVPD